MKKHTRVAKSIHWSFILLYSYGIFKQLDNISELEDNSLLIFEVIFASVFLAIVIMRYFYMRRFDNFLGAQVPVHRIHRLIGKTVHISMYLCLILLPLSGLIIAGLFTMGIKDGWMQDVALGLHEFSASLSYVLIATHVSAAIYSRIKGEGVWSAMVPVLKEDGPSKNEVVAKIAKFENEIYCRIDEFFNPKD